MFPAGRPELPVPGWKAALPANRIAPRPMRLTGGSPGPKVPAASAVIVRGLVAGVPHTAVRRKRVLPGAVLPGRGAQG